ncbi:hypothetical protein CASFOL_039488 [Castilleja foliolosa]|uniref:Uncharacterized protein n=1 Tax=Castilleja foliolosa TaxID=1961234 RepID=A0ABD3BIQ5_9LAMI
MSEIINKEPAGPLFSGDDIGNLLSKAKEPVGPFLDGEDIGHILSKANFIPPKPCNPEKNKLKKVAMHDDEDPRGLDELFPDIPHGYVPPKIVDRGPCWICDGPHSRFICDLLDICPIDRKVPERYKVACDFCCKDAINVINGKCPCGSKTGRVVDKVQMYYRSLHSRFMFQDAKPVAFDGKLGTKRDLMKLRGY